MRCQVILSERQIKTLHPLGLDHRHHNPFLKAGCERECALLCRLFSQLVAQPGEVIPAPDRHSLIPQPCRRTIGRQPTIGTGAAASLFRMPYAICVAVHRSAVPSSTRSARLSTSSALTAIWPRSNSRFRGWSEGFPDELGAGSRPPKRLG